MISPSKQPGPPEGRTWQTNGAGRSVKACRALAVSPPEARSQGPQSRGAPWAGVDRVSPLQEDVETAPGLSREGLAMQAGTTQCHP